ncbi:MAG: HDIG domain-containing protein [Spirochaetota bacterium]|nr:HDIG domain-containing protein [Spirochaetota bacterium]
MVMKSEIRLIFILTLIIILISTALLSINIIGTTYEFSIGDIAEDDIRVPGDIKYRIDSETEMEKQRVSQIVPLVFDRDQSVFIERIKIVETLFNYVSTTLYESPPIGRDDRTYQLIALKSKLPKHMMYSDRVLWELLKHENPKGLRRIINRIMIYIFDGGILREPYDNPLKINNKNISIRTINTSEDTNEISMTIDDLKTIQEIKSKLYKICYSIAPNLTREQLRVVYRIVRKNLKPNLKFNTEESRRRIDEKIRSIKPIYGILKKGQTLVRDGDVVTTEILTKIEVLNKHTASTNISYIAGTLLLQLIIVLIFGYFLMGFYHRLIQNAKSPIIIFSLVLFFILYTFFISRIENIHDSNMIFTLYLPIPFVTMIVSILCNIYVSMIAGVYMVFFIFIIGGASFPIVALAFSSAVLGVFIIGDFKRRTDFLKGGLLLGFINSLVIVALGLIEESSFYPNIVNNVGLSFANGIINSIIVLGIFPIYENLFGVTTKFKLLELSDLNAPIFKDMLIRAPGTYNHSLLVANMAEAACDAIGANSLLAKVGGYYHDIGKIEDAEIYIENMVGNGPPKDLTPSKYSKLIISHVQKGIALAEKEGLPDSIIQFIGEHHGESTMTFFYHQALEEAQNSSNLPEIDKAEFQYYGPKPHSREAAVLMLADSVEAASRSLKDPTEIKLEGLVKKIIYNRLNEGELEYSDLTMSELNKIQMAIIKVLHGIFHTRIGYPEVREIKRIEKRVLKRINEG